MVSVPARSGATSVRDQGRASDRGEVARSTEAKMHADVLIMRVSGTLHDLRHPPGWKSISTRRRSFVRILKRLSLMNLAVADLERAGGRLFEERTVSRV